MRYIRILDFALDKLQKRIIYIYTKVSRTFNVHIKK